MIFTDRSLSEMAEQRPNTIDAFAGISGVGAKKLERYGATFLEVIAGEAAAPAHPARRKLAGRSAGTTYDRLLEAQAELVRGAQGTEKPLSCSAAILSRIAETRPSDPDTMARVLGDRRAERFGAAVLDVLREA